MSTTATRHNLAVAAHEHALMCSDSADVLDVIAAVAPAIGAPRLTIADAVATVAAATSRGRVAEEAGVSLATVATWITGRYAPDAEELAAIRALALRTARELIGAAVSEPTPRARRAEP